MNFDPSTRNKSCSKEFINVFKIIYRKFILDKSNFLPHSICIELIGSALIRGVKMQEELAVDLIKFLLKDCLFLNEIINTEIENQQDFNPFAVFPFFDEDEIFFQTFFILTDTLYKVKKARDNFEGYEFFPDLKVKLSKLKKRKDTGNLRVMCLLLHLFTYFPHPWNLKDLIVTSNELDQLVVLYYTHEAIQTQISVCQCIVSLSRFSRNHGQIFKKITCFLTILEESNFYFEFISAISDSVCWKRFSHSNDFFYKYLENLYDEYNDLDFENLWAAVTAIFKIYKIKTDSKLTEIIRRANRTSNKFFEIRQIISETDLENFKKAFSRCTTEILPKNQWLSHLWNIKYLHFLFVCNIFKYESSADDLFNEDWNKIILESLPNLFNGTPSPKNDSSIFFYISTIKTLLEIYEIGILSSTTFIKSFIKFKGLDFINSCIENVLNFSEPNEQHKFVIMKITQRNVRILSHCIIAYDRTANILNEKDFPSFLNEKLTKLKETGNLQIHEAKEQMFFCNFIESFRKEEICFSEEYFIILRKYFENFEKIFLLLNDSSSQIEIFNHLFSFLKPKLNDQFKFLIIRIIYKKIFQNEFREIILKNKFHEKIKKKISRNFKKGRHLLDNFLWELKKDFNLNFTKKADWKNFKNENHDDIALIFDSKDLEDANKINTLIKSKIESKLKFLSFPS